MTPLETLIEKAARSDHCIALCEGEDPRVIEAAISARASDVARIILVGNANKAKAGLAAAGAPSDHDIEIFDPRTDPRAEMFADTFFRLRKHKGVTLDVARSEIRRSHIAAALLVKTGYADGTLGGAVTTTADIVRAAIQILGLSNDAKMVSSFFLMVLRQPYHSNQEPLVFSDAGLVVDPSAAQLAEIAQASAASFFALTDKNPRIAMLSFSTKGSAAHPAVSKVSEATDIVRAAAPDLVVDGELQFDAAFVPSVAARKAPNSPLGGNANVFIFPSLEAGNIAYKIAQRIGGADAIGPILQGLAQPANDLSRGCSAQDVLHMIAVTVCQCQSNRN